jgi:hypothetical protein
MPTRAAVKKKASRRSGGGLRPATRPASRGGHGPRKSPKTRVAAEPLVEPLRELALAAPRLLEALREIGSLVASLADAVHGLQQVSADLRPSRDDGGTAAVLEAAVPEASREVRLRIEAAQEAITAALVSLPRAEDYAPAAAQLRELATVSPSLMEWLTEVPRLSRPLAGSVRGLKQAAADLQAAREALRTRH